MLPKASSFLSVCLFGAAAISQPASAQSAGVTAEWTVRKQIAALAEHIQKLNPILDQIKPAEWVAKGAPDAYASQLKSVRDQLKYLSYSTQRLTEDPGKLTAALDAFFRIESVNAMLRSIADGVRRYQNPALAELLQGAVADGAGDREQLRQYIVDLAADREAEFKVIDAEAQRCRTALSQQPRTHGARKEERR